MVLKNGSVEGLMEEQLSLLPDSVEVLRWLELDAGVVRQMGAGSHRRRSQMQAVLNWIGQYQPREDDKPLEQVKGYLQAFQHLCALEDWDRALKLLQVPLNTPTREGLLNQLKTWGYGGEQVSLCRQLEGQVDGEWAMVVLNVLGTVEIDRGNFAAGIAWQEQHLALARAEGDTLSAGHALGNLGLAYYHQGETERAIDCLQEAVTCFQVLRELEPEELAQRREVAALQGVLGNLGLAYGVLGDYERAERCHRQSLRLAEVREDQRGAGLTWGCLGRVQQSRGEWDAAAEAYERQWAAGVAAQDRGLVLKGLINRSGLKRARGFYAEAVRLGQEAEALARELGDRHAQGLVAVGLGASWYGLGELERAREVYETGRVWLERTGDRKSLSQALTGLGVVLEELEEVDAAVCCQERALVLAREVGHRDGEAMILGNLASAVATQGDYRWAMELLVESLEMAWELEDRDQERLTLLGMGNVAFWVGTFGEARRFYGLALEIAEELDNRGGQAILLMNLGAVALEMGEFEEAEEWLMQAREVATRLGMQGLLDKVERNCAKLKIED